MTFLSDVVAVCGWTALLTIGTFACGYVMALILACVIELGLFLNRLVGGDHRES